MVEGLRSHEVTDANEDANSWMEKMADVRDKFDEDKAEAARQTALDGIKRIENLRQDEEFRQQELDIYKAREEHGDDPDYTHIYWIRDGELVVRMGDSREELPEAEAVEKYNDNPFFRAEYDFLTRHSTGDDHARIVGSSKDSYPSSDTLSVLEEDLEPELSELEEPELSEPEPPRIDLELS